MPRSHRSGIVAGILATVLVLAIVGIGTVLSGIYDISASAPHTPPVRRMIGALTDRSIRRHATTVDPLSGTDSSGLLVGITHYDEMCAVCHTAPGRKRTEIAAGMYPRPPRLTHEHEEWSDAQLFWIVKHGIKMSGMPAFGPTHSDDIIRDIVALVRRLPSMSPEQYHALLQQAEAEEHSHEEGMEERTGSGSGAGEDGQQD